jgi:hypothetical protein
MVERWKLGFVLQSAVQTAALPSPSAGRCLVVPDDRHWEGPSPCHMPRAKIGHISQLGDSILGT